MIEEFYKNLRIFEIRTDQDGLAFENVGVRFRVMFPNLSEVYIDSDHREYTAYVERGEATKDVLDGLKDRENS